MEKTSRFLLWSGHLYKPLSYKRICSDGSLIQRRKRFGKGGIKGNVLSNKLQKGWGGKGKKKRKKQGGRWWHKSIYSMTLQFRVWSVVYTHMYTVNRDGVVSDKIMQTVFKIPYLFLRSDWHLYKKEVKFR